MTPRMVMPMLKAIPTPSIMLIRARQRPIALRSGYGSRSRSDGVSDRGKTSIRGVSAVVCIGPARRLGVELTGFVHQNAKRLFAGRGGALVTTAESAFHQVRQCLRESIQRWDAQHRR